MISWKSKLVNATLAATAAIPLATAGMFMSGGSAQALTLSGSIGLNGTSLLTNTGSNPTNTRIRFLDVDGVDATGDFAKFLPVLGANPSSPQITLSTLNLTRTSVISSTQATYSTGAVTSFIDFGLRTLGSTIARLTFDLDNSSITRLRLSSSNINNVTLEGITGKFNFNGQTLATGFVNASLSGSSSTYNLTLKTVSVPEPGTVLGLGLVGAGMVMSRRRKSVAQ